MFILTWALKFIPAGWLIAGAGVLFALMGAAILVQQVQIANAATALSDAKREYGERVSAAQAARDAALIEQMRLGGELATANMDIGDAYDAAEESRQLADTARRDADAARGVALGLRGVIASYAAGTTRASCATPASPEPDDRAAVLGGLLIESADLLEEGRRLSGEGESAIEGARNQLAGLRSYAVNVCRPMVRLGG